MSTTDDLSGLMSDLADTVEGDIDDLIHLLYDELREIAHRHLAREADGHTIDTTALVHEAYIVLADKSDRDGLDRAHFLALSSRVMRHVLVDHARRRGAAKRGGGRVRVPLTPSAAKVLPAQVDLLDLDRALDALASRDEQLAHVVECRYFGGMTEVETGEALDVSARTVRRAWKRAKVYLLQELEG